MFVGVAPVALRAELFDIRVLPLHEIRADPALQIEHLFRVFEVMLAHPVGHADLRPAQLPQAHDIGNDPFAGKRGADDGKGSGGVVAGKGPGFGELLFQPQHPGRQDLFGDPLEKAAGKVGVGVNVHDQLLEAPDVGRQAEGGTEADGDLGPADEPAEDPVGLDDMTTAPGLVEVRRLDFFQVFPVPDQGPGAVHVRHVLVAVDHRLPQGLGLDIVHVVVEHRHVDPVALHDLEGAGRQQVRGGVKFSGGKAEIFHGELVHLGQDRHPVGHPAHGGSIPPGTLFKPAVIAFEVHHLLPHLC